MQAVERRVMHHKNLTILTRLRQKLQKLESAIDYGLNPEAIIDTE